MVAHRLEHGGCDGGGDGGGGGGGACEVVTLSYRFRVSTDGGPREGVRFCIFEFSARFLAPGLTKPDPARKYRGIHQFWLTRDLGNPFVADFCFCVFCLWPKPPSLKRQFADNRNY